MKKTLAAITVGLIWVIGTSSANAQTLYDSTKNQKLDQQGWTYRGTTISTAPSATATSSGTLLKTGNTANYSGYFKQSPIKLDRTQGYTISFSVKINSENHGTNNNRAGFSMIVMSDAPIGQRPYGLELAFWQNKIWTQNAGFTQGEGAFFNTTNSVNNYTLWIQGTQYKLYANGSTNPILQGSLRQYTGYTPPPGYPNPYTIPNMLFMGDNTTSATTEVLISNVYATPVQ